MIGVALVVALSLIACTAPLETPSPVVIVVTPTQQSTSTAVSPTPTPALMAPPTVAEFRIITDRAAQIGEGRRQNDENVELDGHAFGSGVSVCAVYAG